MVKRVARAANDPRQLLPHPPQARDPAVDLVELLRDARANRFVRPAAARQPGVLGDLLEREPEPLCLFHGLDEADGLLVIVAVAGYPTPGVPAAAARLVPGPRQTPPRPLTRDRPHSPRLSKSATRP